MKNILIIGQGEVGSSLKKILDDSKHYVEAHDPDKKIIANMNISYEIIHICFPFHNYIQFMTAFQNLLNFLKKNLVAPRFIIINSTIPLLELVGKLEIFELIQIITNKTLIQRKCIIIHQPVRGTHPNLENGIRTYPNFIGLLNKEGLELYREEISEYYDSLGLPYEFFDSVKETSLSKIIDTTHYYLNIGFCNQMKLLCDKLNINFDQSYTRLMETDEIGRKYEYDEEINRCICKENIPRPVMYPGRVGGHCLRQNLEFLKRLTPKMYNWLFEMAEEFEER